MARTRAFVFDMDGTMVDSMPAHARSWDVFRRRHQVPMGVDEILRRTTGKNGAECMRVLFGEQLADDEAWRLSYEKEAIYRDLFGREFRAVPGLQDFVAEAVGRGLRFAVASGGDKKNVGFALDHLKLPHAPDAIVAGDDGFPGKPEPALFLEAARRLQLASAECLVFEDAPFGVQAAERAGMRAVAICTTHAAGELAGRHVIAQARDFDELLKLNFLESLDA